MFARSQMTMSVALVLGASSALGQTTRTSPSAASTISTVRSSSSASPSAPCYSSNNPSSPCYSATGTPSYSATSPNSAATPNSSAMPYSSTKPTVSSPNVPNPQASEHSFTADQARSRIEAKGYSNVSGLQKDAKGTWRGKAMKDGKPVTVILDFQGAIVANE